MNITYLLPYSYINILNKFLNCKSFLNYLDVGCGDGSLLNDLNIKNKAIVGVDIDERSCEIARTKNIYKKVICGDVLKEIQRLNNNSFDCVYSSQVVEHLNKNDALTLISEIERVTKKRIVISTIVGFFDYDPVEDRDDSKNPYQKHNSGWQINEFEKLGFKVYGKGSKKVYGTNGIARKNMAFKLFGFLISYLLSPYFYYFPKNAMYLIAVKDL